MSKLMSIILTIKYLNKFMFLWNIHQLKENSINIYFET
jgi:hypothetical protein